MVNLFKALIIFLFTSLISLSTAATESRPDKFIEANGLKIHYQEGGNGPPLLLIHGGGLTSKSWKGMAAVAAKNFRVIMPDSRGHGLTNNPDGQFRYDLMAEDMAELIKALKLEKPLVMGYSDGGMVVLKLISRYPDLASAAVVGGATHRFASAHYMKGMEVFYGKGAPHQVLTDAYLSQMARDMPEMVTFFQNMHHPEQPEYWRIFLKNIWPMWTTPFSIAEDVKKIQVPVMVIAGDRDEFFTVEEVTELYHLLPKGEMAIIPGSGHAIFQSPDKSTLFYMSTTAFLKQQVAKR
ncbi:alpha/beta fold hydrolase [Escherichia fergusonii]|uniref:alpha/beta fold hydrolase n=1 Tax=Escherichia fergusonii TaxID=564 RepID=UPI0022312536|nr:alpha/beta hydrolase [Escherichia fergusonii]